MNDIEAIDALRTVVRALQTLTGSWTDREDERRVRHLLDPVRGPLSTADLGQVAALTLGTFLGPHPMSLWPDVFLRGIRRQGLILPDKGDPPSWLKLDTTLGQVADYLRTGVAPKASEDAPQPRPFGAALPAAAQPQLRGHRAIPPAAYAPPVAAAPAAPASFAPAGSPAPAPTTPGGRFVNTWFYADSPVPPLERGRWYEFRLDIGPRRADASAQAFAEPDFGTHHQIPLRVDLFSRDVDIEVANPVLILPRTGASTLFGARVRPRKAGPCRLDIVLSLARELDVLQTLIVEVEAIEPRIAVAAAEAR